MSVAPAAAVVDTHALVWYSTGRTRRLGRRARALFDRACSGRATLHVPTTCLMEVGEAVRAGRIGVPRFDGWLDGLLASGHFLAADLTVDVVRRAQTLYAIPERADRLIAATAAELDLPLVTRDPEIAKVAGLDLIW